MVKCEKNKSISGLTSKFEAVFNSAGFDPVGDISADYVLYNTITLLDIGNDRFVYSYSGKLIQYKYVTTKKETMTIEFEKIGGVGVYRNDEKEFESLRKTFSDFAYKCKDKIKKRSTRNAQLETKP